MESRDDWAWHITVTTSPCRMTFYANCKFQNPKLVSRFKKSISSQCIFKLLEWQHQSPLSSSSLSAVTSFFCPRVLQELIHFSSIQSAVMISWIDCDMMLMIFRPRILLALTVKFGAVWVKFNISFVCTLIKYDFDFARCDIITSAFGSSCWITLFEL